MTLAWAAAVAFVVLLALVLRLIWLRWNSFGTLRDLRRRFRSRIDRHKLESPLSVRAELIRDPEVAAAVADHVRETGESEERARARVHEYVVEIVPSFNLVSYYRLGYGAARLLVPLFYKLSVVHEAREALDAIPRDSIVLYAMNHRSNADYVVVAYVLSGEVALSYAVGEWARVWPLEAVFKSFGSYFVRRRYREALYHKVLERYVHLITRHGVTQGIFLEGGLSRDGRLRAPKLGLLDYVLSVKRNTSFVRPIHIIPVALNYDRVLEDRSLLRETQEHTNRLSRIEQFREVASYVAKVSFRFLLRRARRYGRACVSFGPPLSVDAWLAARPGVLSLPREERLPHIQELGDELMARIGAVMPVTPVCLVAETLLRHTGAFIERTAWIASVEALRSELRARDAHQVSEERTSSEILDRALVMLTLRRVVTPEGEGFSIDRSHDSLLRFYANSIAHLFAAPAGSSATLQPGNGKGPVPMGS